MACSGESSRQPRASHRGFGYSEVPGVSLTLDEMAAWTAERVGGTFERWPVEVRCLDLVEEVGELARAVLVDRGHKLGPGEDLTVAVCGVLMDVLIVAHDSGVRLDAAYPDLVDQLVRQALSQPPAPVEAAR